MKSFMTPGQCRRAVSVRHGARSVGQCGMVPGQSSVPSVRCCRIEQALSRGHLAQDFLGDVEVACRLAIGQMQGRAHQGVVSEGSGSVPVRMDRRRTVGPALLPPPACTTTRLNDHTSTPDNHVEFQQHSTQLLASTTMHSTGSPLKLSFPGVGEVWLGLSVPLLRLPAPHAPCGDVWTLRIPSNRLHDFVDSFSHDSHVVLGIHVADDPLIAPQLLPKGASPAPQSRPVNHAS